MQLKLGKVKWKTVAKAVNRWTKRGGLNRIFMVLEIVEEFVPRCGLLWFYLRNSL